MGSGEWKSGCPLIPIFGIECVAFSPGGRTIAVGGRDKVVSVWEVAEARSLVEEMAKGAPEETVTVEAKAQLLRMKNKDR